MTNSNQNLSGEGTLKTNNPKISVVNIRSNPVIKEGNIVHKGKPSDRVKLIAQIKPEDDKYTWYKVRFGQQQNDLGWVRADVITLLKQEDKPPIQNPSEAETRLYFETDTKKVRIYGQGQAHINVYDKKSEVTELNRVPATKLPNNDPQNPWTTYVASNNGFTYLVRFIPNAQTELTISPINDDQAKPSQNGFSANGIEYRKNA